MNRPILGKLFEEKIIGDKRGRDKRIVEAVERFGYSQRRWQIILGCTFHRSAELCGESEWLMLRK